MKFSEKYRELNDRAMLQELVTTSVYSTMALENQTIPRDYLSQIVRKVLKLRASK